MADTIATIPGISNMITIHFQPPEKDNTEAYKKCHSQFTDTADYRRSGLNTWQDESGLYANTEAKRTVFKKTDTIPDRLD